MTASIQMLPEEVVNKIAAGEVVERPASVVKELVENAIDAEATDIQVFLKDGGLQEITVIDDGSGIAAEELPVAIRRHATSKIRQDSDLFEISSMGFRGEALAALAAAGELTLSSKQPGKEGRSLTVAAGNAMAPTPWGGSDGTRVSLGKLFSTIPARAKFLRSSQAELAAAMEIIQALALAHPKKSFSLSSDERTKLNFPKAPEDLGQEQALRHRLSQVIGGETVGKLLWVEQKNMYGQVFGLASPPGIEKATSKHVFTFVNGRWVKDQILRYGVLRGYQTHLLKGKHPVCCLFYLVDPSLVDVNVHPAKTEVRFQYRTEVQGLIAAAIRDGIRAGDWLGTQSTSENSPSRETPAVPNVQATTVATRKPEPTPTRHFKLDFDRPAPNMARPKEASLNRESPIERPTAAAPQSTPISVESPAESLGVVDHKADNKPKIPWGETTFQGSLFRCYLLFEWHNNVVVVDQHAFHERILFEKLMADPSTVLTGQKLMFPDQVTLSPTATRRAHDLKAKLFSWGFAYAETSTTTLEISAVPEILQNRNTTKLFDQLTANDLAADEIHHHLAATIACHSAVRSGDDLDDRRIQDLLKQAEDVDFYANCPHGRRVLRVFSPREIGGWFDRL